MADKRTSTRAPKRAAQKRTDLILAAKQVFYEDGYQLASMDRIAIVSGVSKRTYYDYFGSKESLFEAAVQYACTDFVASLPKLDNLPENPLEGLRAIAQCVRGLLTIPEAVRFQRMVVAEAERQPKFGRMLLEAVQVAEELTVRYLTRGVDAGLLRSHDVRATSRLILDLAAGGNLLRALFSGDSIASERLDKALLQLGITLVVQEYELPKAAAPRKSADGSPRGRR